MTSPAALASERFGSPTAARTRSSAATAERLASATDQSASLPWASASLKAASAYGRAMVLGSAMFP